MNKPMMSKLNEIEIALSHGWAHGRSKAEVNWLIARVRKLETALRRASDENLCLCPYASEDKHTDDCLHIVVADALKED